MYLVTGGTGFFGKNFVDLLLSEGHKVRVVDFRPLAIDDPAWKENVEFVQADIRSYEDMEKVTQGVERVFHLAAIPSIAKANKNIYKEINIDGTHNVAKAAKKNGVKHMVHVSSSTVYGVPVKFPLKEEDVVEQVGNYGWSKIQAEKAALDLSDENFSVSVIRPRVVMGPGRMGIFSLLFDRISSGKTVFMIGKGENLFQFTDVNDLSRACLMASNMTKTNVYNIGAEEMGTVKEDLQKLIAHSGKKSRLMSLPIGFAKFALEMTSKVGIAPLMSEQFSIADKNFKLDTSRAQKEFGWKPSKSNYDTLKEAYDWYCENVKGTSQFKSIFSVFGKFNHSQQGAFQKSGKESDFNKL